MPLRSPALERLRSLASSVCRCPDAAMMVRICVSPVLDSSASLVSSLCPVLASYASPPPQPQPRSPTALSLCHVQGSRVRRRRCLRAAPCLAPLLVVSISANLWFPRLLIMIQRLWDCSDSGRGEIPAWLADAGSGDACECRSLLRGAAMAPFLCPSSSSRGNPRSDSSNRTVAVPQRHPPS